MKTCQYIFCFVFGVFTLAACGKFDATSRANAATSTPTPKLAVNDSPTKYLTRVIKPTSTRWSPDYSLTPTPIMVPGFPTPQSPGPQYFYAKQILIGEYAVRVWLNTDNFFVDILTISKIGGPRESISLFEGFYDLSGTDITGEGNPDVIFYTWSGGAHCCYTTFVYDLGTNAAKVMEADTRDCRGSFEDLDQDGAMEFVTCDTSFAYYNLRCCYACAPRTKVIFQYEAGKGYVVANPKFPYAYEEDIARHQEEINVWDEDHAWNGQVEAFKEVAQCEVLPLILDYLFSGEIDKAWETLYFYYRFSDVEAFKADIQRIVESNPLFVYP